LDDGDAMSFLTSIHTVYKPQENLDQLNDWLSYHSHIGFKKFYMYDNGSSFKTRAQDFFKTFDQAPTKNFYGYSHKYSLTEARKKQEEIFSLFNVEYVVWDPVDATGKPTFNQFGAIKHYYENASRSLTAFIDVDEFIIKKESFYPSRMVQKKYHSIHEYDRVYEISKCLKQKPNINWASKVILDTSEHLVSDVLGMNVHMGTLDLPVSKNYFNHYNYNEFLHKWLVDNYLDLKLFDDPITLKNFPELLEEEEEINDVRTFFKQIVK
jgi:hypothetical protein